MQILNSNLAAIGYYGQRYIDGQRIMGYLLHQQQKIYRDEFLRR